MQPVFLVFSLCGALIPAALSAFAITRNPRNPANIGFALGMACVSAGEAGSFLYLAGLGLERGGLDLIVAGLALMPAPWLLFSAAFARGPRPNMKRWAPALLGLAAIPAYFIVHTGTRRLVSGAMTPDGHLLIPGAAGRLFFIYLILGLLPVLVQLENTFRSSKGPKRWKIKYIIFGVGTLLAFFIYLSSQAILFRALDPGILPVKSAMVLISSVLLSVFIVRHRLLDVDIYISRYVVYNSVSVLATGGYLIAVGLLAHGINRFGMPFDYFFTMLFLFTSLLGFFLLLFSDVARRRLETFISHFYRHKYEFKDKWMETLEGLGDKRGISSIISAASDMITSSMGAGGVHVWLYDRGKRAFCLAGADTAVPPPVRQLPCGGTAGCAGDSGRPFRTDGVSWLDGLAPGGLCAFMRCGAEEVGLIVARADISGKPYTQDDLDLLGAIAAEAAVQIKALTMAEDLMAAKEYEVFHQMSAFIIHDLKNFTNSLSLVSQNARLHLSKPEFQRDAMQAIDSTVFKMKSLMERLGRAPEGLELKKEPCDLGSILDGAVLMVKRGAPGTVRIRNLTSEAVPVTVDVGSVEMVFVNLLTNACDALDGKGEIRVRAWRSGASAAVSISDTGAGLTDEMVRNSLFKPFRSTKSGGLGIGLHQCKTVIEAHDGQIEAGSAAGGGACFTVRLPLSKEAARMAREANGK